METLIERTTIPNPKAEINMSDVQTPCRVCINSMWLDLELGIWNPWGHFLEA